MSGREYQGPHEPPPDTRAEHHELEPEYVLEDLDAPHAEHAEHQEPVAVSRVESDDWLIESSTDTGVTSYRLPPRQTTADAGSRPPSDAAAIAPGSVQPRPRAGHPFLSPQRLSTQPLGSASPLPNERAPRSSGSFVIPEQRRAQSPAADGGEARQRVVTPMPAVVAAQGQAAGPRRSSSPPPPPSAGQPHVEARQPSLPPDSDTRTLITPPPGRAPGAASHSQYVAASVDVLPPGVGPDPVRNANESRQPAGDVGARAEASDPHRPRPLPRAVVGHTRLLITPPPPRSEPSTTSSVEPATAVARERLTADARSSHAPERPYVQSPHADVATAHDAHDAADASRSHASQRAEASDSERAKIDAARASAIFAFARALIDVPHPSAPAPSARDGSERAGLDAARSSAIFAFARALVDAPPDQAVPAFSDPASAGSSVEEGSQRPEPHASRSPLPPPMPARPVTDARARRDSGRATLPPPMPTRIDVDAPARAVNAGPASASTSQSAAVGAVRREPEIARRDAALPPPSAAEAAPRASSVPPPRAARADGERTSAVPPPPPIRTDPGTAPRTTTGSGARASIPAADESILRAQLQQALARARQSELRLAQAELRARRAEMAAAAQRSQAMPASQAKSDRAAPPATGRRPRFQFLIWCAVCFSVGGYVSLLVPIRNQMRKQDAALREVSQRQSLAVELERRRCEGEQHRLDAEKQELAQKLQDMQDALPVGKAPPARR